ncbi:Uncharacterised protein [Salmonella enterica subsp. enterica serovar Bovismorbificans]|nr:Uncharacterised protein [Salmonella enterica subsp. enterica serovar Bovismorbificans]
MKILLWAILIIFLIPAPGSDSICPAHVLDAVEIRF